MQPSPSGELRGVVLYAGDIERMAEFYARVLGLSVVERTDSYVVLSGGRSDVSIVAVPDAVASGEPVYSDVRERTPIKPSFRVASLASVVTAARMHGGGTKPLSTAWEFRGLRHLDGFDPEGNVVQFVEPV
jgi:catechol 2,3-dioxygenase-like lactoylglutathione lyase family enzyme